MLSYTDFIDSLRQHRYPDQVYYSLIVYFKDEILLDIAKANQGIIARKLNMHQTRLSPITFLLKLDIQLDDSAQQELEDYLAIEGII